ncbi:cytohesin-interacting protein [Denticeps clupeoides]|uniref:Si:dkey-276j7.2 n=1 Tax=Denticeps clupeoides TaxID=299321 RepID=A0AAY4AQF8_9TELE|nr:cytohesin-interacting protein-like [Denticeps clupeoides]
MTTRTLDSSFRHLVTKSSSFRNSLWKKISPRHRNGVPSVSIGRDIAAARPQETPGNPSKSLNHSTGSIRRRVVLEKQENEMFGFEVQDGDMGPVVKMVEVGGPAERAGLRTGDVLVAVNGVFVAGFRHECVAKLFHSSDHIMRLETMCGQAADLHRKLSQLEARLGEKRAELCALTSREELLCGGGGDLE